MPLPALNQIYLPLLKLVADKEEHQLKELSQAIVEHFKLTQEERDQTLANGSMTVIRNRVGWAKKDLHLEGLLEATRRGVFRITKKGLSVLEMRPESLSRKDFDYFTKYQSAETNDSQTLDGEEGTPLEAIETASNELRNALAAEILEQLKSSHPRVLEKTVLKLLLKMGYGGVQAQGTLTKRSNDEGIDGIIWQDVLGLETVYLQAKRYKEDNSVGRPEIHKFTGALHGQFASKGIFITTSKFSREAEQYVEKIQDKIILINGKRLAELMIEFNVGVLVEKVVEIKSLNTDFFAEDF